MASLTPGTDSIGSTLSQGFEGQKTRVDASRSARPNSGAGVASRAPSNLRTLHHRLTFSFHEVTLEGKVSFLGLYDAPNWLVRHGNNSMTNSQSMAELFSHF